MHVFYLPRLLVPIIGRTWLEISSNRDSKISVKTWVINAPKNRLFLHIFTDLSLIAPLIFLTETISFMICNIWISFPLKRSTSRPGFQKKKLNRYSWFLVDEFSSKTVSGISQKFANKGFRIFHPRKHGPLNPRSIWPGLCVPDYFILIISSIILNNRVLFVVFSN